MKSGLLDINVLLALAWPKHQDHGKACAWFASEASHGWASCTLTQAGFIRLSSNPAFTARAVAPSAAAKLLAEMTCHTAHRFWSGIAVCEPAIFIKARGHRQVADAYLIELARKNKGRLITLDAGAAQHAHRPDEFHVIV